MNSTESDDVLISGGDPTDANKVLKTLYRPMCADTSQYDHIIKIATPVIMIVGTFFNILSFIVFMRPNLRGVVTTLFYRFFVLSDAVMLQVIGWAIIARFYFDITCCDSQYLCRLVQFLINVFMDFNAWVLCILHVNAHGLVAYPHKANVAWTIGRALMIGLAALVLALGLNLPVFVMSRINFYWAVAKIIWATSLAFFIPVVLNILINITLHRTTHQENIGCCKLTSMAIIILSIYVINTCLNLPFNLNQLLVAMEESDDVTLLPGYVRETTWRVVVPFFCLLACSTIKFAVFRSICPRFSGECNQTWGCKVTTMRPLGAQAKSQRTHIHMDSEKFAKNATTKKSKKDSQSKEPSTQQESVANDKNGLTGVKENGNDTNGTTTSNGNTNGKF